jgi:hypothetical protein
MQLNSYLSLECKNRHLEAYLMPTSAIAFDDPQSGLKVTCALNKLPKKQGELKRVYVHPRCWPLARCTDGLSPRLLHAILYK